MYALGPYGLCTWHIDDLIELHEFMVTNRIHHREICPRHLLIRPDGGLLLIDHGFGSLPDEESDPNQRKLTGACEV